MVRVIVDRPRVARALGLGFVLVLIGMVAFNLWTVPSLQKQVFRVDRFKLRPHNIAAVADDSWINVSHYIPTYHRLHVLAGKTVRIDAREEKASRFYLERLSQLHVEVSPVPLELPADTETRLAGRITRSWWLGKPRLKIVLDLAAPRYVLAHGDKMLFLVPEPIYDELLASAAVVPVAPAAPAPAAVVPVAPAAVQP